MLAYGMGHLGDYPRTFPFTDANYALNDVAGSTSPMVAGKSTSGVWKVLGAVLVGAIALRALTYLPSFDLNVGNIGINVWNVVAFLALYMGAFGLVKVLVNLVPLGIVTDYINFL